MMSMYMYACVCPPSFTSFTHSFFHTHNEAYTQERRNEKWLAKQNDRASRMDRCHRAWGRQGGGAGKGKEAGRKEGGPCLLFFSRPVYLFYLSFPTQASLEGCCPSIKCSSTPQKSPCLISSPPASSTLIGRGRGNFWQPPSFSSGLPVLFLLIHVLSMHSIS